ncbi:Nitrogen regulation protein NIFR3 [Staphylococcus aureus]|nr:Nitrogen regulation protein NIFR3 [Staphylococcus aureus]
MKMRLQQAFFNSSQGPQQREIGFPISTDNASWGVGPNTENFEKKFYRQCKLGCGPQHREFRKEILQAMRVGVWAPTQKLTKSQLTIMCKLAGPQQREIGFPISTDSASWGGTTIKKYFFYRN